jgi:RNA polymerase sigma-70 factor (ECF subfamily)
MRRGREPGGSDAAKIITDNSSDLLAYFERRADDGDAADLLSETMFTAWRRSDAVPTDHTEARMWLFGIARLTLANAQRSSLRRWKLADRLRGHLLAYPSTSDEAEAIDVRDAVRRLPAEHRDLVGLVHWEGFSLVEAAQIIGIPASTARGRYQAARQRLANMLTQHESPAPTRGAS